MQGRVHERRNVENPTLGHQRAHVHAVEETAEDRVAAAALKPNADISKSLIMQ